MNIEIRLDAKRALITAGAAGIGRAAADLMVSCGARVHICDINASAVDTIQKERNPNFTATVADVADPHAVERFFSEALAALGGIDILVNNAGIAGPVGPVEDIPPDGLARALAVNLEAQFYCIGRAVPHLKAHGGVILNVSSVAGVLPYPLRSAYAASKWGVIGLTKTLAAELGPHHIRVNAICPGAVDGPPIAQAIKRRALAKGITEAEARQEYLSQSTMALMTTAEDVAKLIVFLCSDAARTISGQAIGIDANTIILN